MLIPKKNRVAIYEYLFKEGVLVARKDPFAAKHPDIEVPNLHVMKALTVSYVMRVYLSSVRACHCFLDQREVAGHAQPV